MKKILKLLLVAMIALPVLAHAGKQNFPPPELVGTWACSVEIFGPFKAETYPSKHPDDTQEVTITINADGTVEGKIGNAIFKNASVHKNRGWIGRKLNLKTDFIVSGGTLKGKVTPRDKGTDSKFTIPFNMEEETLKGIIMLLPKFPLTRQMNLEKKNPEPENSHLPEKAAKVE
jgi:hypothetical protein